MKPICALSWSNLFNVNVFCVSGPVVMDMSGYSEKGFKRKLAVQALFGKVFYLSEVVTKQFFSALINVSIYFVVIWFVNRQLYIFGLNDMRNE